MNISARRVENPRVVTNPGWMSIHATTPNNALPTWLVALFIPLVTLTTLWPFWLGLLPDSHKAYMLRDMMIPFNVSVNDLSLGMGEHAPLAIPQDTLLAILSPAIPASFFAAFCVLVAAAFGIWDATRMARDMAGANIATQLICGLFVVWNPFVIERFLQGQWSFALAAMLLPSIAYYSAASIRSGQLIALAYVGLTPTGLVLGGIVALVFDQSWRRRLVTVIATAGISAPWLLVTLVNQQVSHSSPASAHAFAVGPDNPLGTIASVLGMGGIWNIGAIPPSRGWVGGIAGLVVFLIAVIGCRELWRVYRPVAVLTVAAFTVPLLIATPPGRGAMGWAVSAIPGVAMFRDSQKLVALALPGMILLLAAASQLIGRQLKNLQLRQFAPVALALLIIATVPNYPKDMAPVAPQDMSPAWEQVTKIVSGSPSGSVLLLPPGNYRLRGDGEPTLTPALKMTPGSPIDPQYLVVDGQLIDGDPAAIELLRQTVSGNDALADSGVGWVLVDRPSMTDPRSAEQADKVLARHQRLMDIDGIELYRIANPEVHTTEGSSAPLWAGMIIYWSISVAGVWLAAWEFIKQWYTRRQRRQR